MIAFNNTTTRLIRVDGEAGGGSAECRSLPAGAGAHSLAPAPATGPLLIVDEMRRRIVRDAEFLLSVIAWTDIPGRVAIIEAAPNGTSGFSIGSGHRLAAVFGVRAEVAIGMNAAQLCDYGRYRARSAAEAAYRSALIIESTAVHELAHAIASQFDETTSVVGLPSRTIADFVSGSLTAEQPTAIWLAGHGTAWAAAHAILAARAMRLRHKGSRRVWRDMMRVDFRAHCLPPYENFADAVADIHADAPIRQLLSDAEWLAHLPSLSIDDRLAIHRRQSPRTTLENTR